VDEDYMALIKECYESGHLEGSMNIEVTSLISKGGTISLLKNY
jgi:hypothetical protein